ncbi:putative laccase 1d precursor [Mycena rebaudengoi]|nr:putative laccase 1d precursor [Mycena rebaudengoi]
MSWLTLLCLLPTVLAEQKIFNLDIVNARLSPDGYERDTVVPNGTFPGPVFKTTKGDSVVIHVHNKLTSPGMRRSTSIHWHGFLQARTSGMDGPSFVNQCPIAPSASFDYVFDTAGQTGNYWYHSHLSTQYCDGLRGAFVVYDPDDPLKYLYDMDDDSTIITLADWYHNLAPKAQNDFFQNGTAPCAIFFQLRFNKGPEVPYAVITVKYGLRYRFRVFSLSCRPFMTLSFDNHTFDVMELDGVEHDPVAFQNADIHAAQRLSIILHANQTVGNYWAVLIISDSPTGGSPASNPNFNASLTKAILRYVGAPDEEPTTADPGGAKLDDGLMHPILAENPGRYGSGPPGVPPIRLEIDKDSAAPFFRINNISYLSPSLPVLLQLLSGAAKPTDFIPSEQVIVLPKNTIVDVTIPNNASHPFHLHGHNFDVIQQPNSAVFNYKNPARRDVQPISGNTTFRFYTDNPGAWFLHCHIDWHLEAGLAVVFGEAPEDNITGPQSQIQTADWKALCPTYDDLPPELQ